VDLETTNYGGTGGFKTGGQITNYNFPSHAYTHAHTTRVIAYDM
jgi:hypothetical protein